MSTPRTDRAAAAPIKVADRVKGIRYAVRDVVVLADELRRQGRQMFYLNIGDPNIFGFRPPEHVLDATWRAMRDNLNGYAPSEGIGEALDAIGRHARKQGIREIIHVWIGSGLSEVIDMALTALVDAGDNVLTPSPGYPLYTALLSKLQAESRPYQLDEERGWQPDTEDMARRIDGRTRAVVVINPNNPTGSVASEETLRRILDLAVEHDLVVFADEIYDRILFDGERHVPLGSLRPEATVLTLNGLSKNWVVPGFRIGWGILSGDPDRLRAYVEGIKQLGRARLSANHPEQYAIAPALDGSQEHLLAMNRELAARRDLALRVLGEAEGISCVRPRGAFYAFPRLALGVPDETWCRELMQETGVVVVPGSGFGQRPGTQHFRIVLLPGPKVLEEACRRIVAFSRRAGA